MKLGVVGLGKLGSCLAALLAQTHDVIGIDLDGEAVEAINARRSPPKVVEPGLDVLLEHGKLVASTDFADLRGCEAIFILVPTPSTKDNTFTHKFVGQALGSIYHELALQRTVPIVIVSTLTPGSIWRLHRDCQDWLGDDADQVELIYSPVFVALGQVVRDLQRADAMLIGTQNGLTSDNVNWLVQLYQRSIFVGITKIHVMTWQEAELAKLFLNVMLSVKSLYANELAILAQSACADANRILSFVGTDKRIGSKMLGAGFPPGGPCLPRDVRCISALARRCFGRNNLFAVAEEISAIQMKEMLAEIVYDLKSPVGVCGLGYKPGTPVMEEAPAAAVIEALTNEGFDVFVHDFTIDLRFPWQITNLDGLVKRVSSLVFCTNDIGYPLALTPQMLEGKIVYDVWGILTPEQAEACAMYARFGNWR